MKKNIKKEKTINQELLIRKQNESDATSWWKPKIWEIEWDVEYIFLGLSFVSHVEILGG